MKLTVERVAVLLVYQELRKRKEDVVHKQK